MIRIRILILWTWVPEKCLKFRRRRVWGHQSNTIRSFLGAVHKFRLRISDEWPKFKTSTLACTWLCVNIDECASPDMIGECSMFRHRNSRMQTLFAALFLMLTLSKILSWMESYVIAVRTSPSLLVWNGWAPFSGKVKRCVSSYITTHMHWTRTRTERVLRRWCCGHRRQGRSHR